MPASESVYRTPQRFIDNEIKEQKDIIKDIKENLRHTKSAKKTNKQEATRKYREDLADAKANEAKALENCGKDKVCRSAVKANYKIIYENLKAARDANANANVDDAELNKELEMAVKQLEALQKKKDDLKEQVREIEQKIYDKTDSYTAVKVKLEGLAAKKKAAKKANPKANVDNIKAEMKLLDAKKKGLRDQIRVLQNQRLNIRIFKLGTSKLPDFSIMGNISKCFEKPKPQSPPRRSPPPRYNPPPRRSPPRQPKQPSTPVAESATIKALKAHYTSLFESGATFNKAFILLKLHPDKLPMNLKEMIADDLKRNDKRSNLFSSRFFSEIMNRLNTQQPITLVVVKSILNSKSLVGGRRKLAYV